jgi:3-hydroxyethyl bacteriochlorophyllide a dehydrogenase
MHTQAVVFQQPHRIGLQSLDVADPGADDVVVKSTWSGISAGTEKLLFEGRMPAFPGMGYPLVPGYETVGRVVSVGRKRRSSRSTARAASARARSRWPISAT